MTTVYFVRHAQPERSANSIYTDRTYPLTAKGIEDRKLVNDFLRDKSIDVVLSSPFKRAVDTVAEFAGQIGLEVELVEDFRERAITEKWLGHEEFKIFARKQWDDLNYKLPGGESIAEVKERKLNALYDVLRRYSGKNIVIGTHGMALSSLLLHFDKNFGYEEHIQMPMPWVCKMVFAKPLSCDEISGKLLDGMSGKPEFCRDICFDILKIDLFNPQKKTVYEDE